MRQRGGLSMTKRAFPVALTGSPAAIRCPQAAGWAVPPLAFGLGASSLARPGNLKAGRIPFRALMRPYIIGTLALVAMSHINPVADRKQQFTEPIAKTPVFSRNVPDCERGRGAG